MLFKTHIDFIKPFLKILIQIMVTTYCESCEEEVIEQNGKFYCENCSKEVKGLKGKEDEA